MSSVMNFVGQVNITLQMLQAEAVVATLAEARAVVTSAVEEAAKKTTIILRATICSARCAEGKGTLFRGVSRGLIDPSLEKRR
jgi:hypothetical protein